MSVWTLPMAAVESTNTMYVSALLARWSRARRAWYSLLRGWWWDKIVAPDIAVKGPARAIVGEPHIKQGAPFTDCCPWVRRYMRFGGQLGWD